ncbi:MAG: precorrin-6y C5,15-methyltransferase (decarboxylating) subunit CbiE [Coriobacteriaceae bacterium]|nr:precorrin-6y C5,15-methyltransferase (decarboxylating) subunit CbiE [Coriobacteriaceae bacterium]
MKVYVIGVGMGNVDTLTVGALRAIESCEVLIGAQRLLDAFESLPAQKLVLVRADDIVSAVDRAASRGAAQVAVLMSGDVGFYSGAAGLYGRLRAYDVQAMPGVSSLVYFCAKLQTAWQDAALVSAHGREHDAVGTVQSHAKTFCIAGGKTKVQDICRQLAARGMGELDAAVGERLSYPDEYIVRATVAELAQGDFADLSVLLVWNDEPLQPEYGAPALPDAAFERGAVPMTKEEVRALAIAKLRIAAGHTVWDIGAGTGSVSVEAARAAYRGRVFAVERNPEALRLIHANRDKHGAANLFPVEGEAPAALADLPVPDRAFIGGSAGNLDAIVDAVLEANAAARICISAVTLETLSAATACLRERGIADADIVQVQVSRVRAAGSYHLMQAENPVYLITFGGAGAGDAR